VSRKEEARRCERRANKKTSCTPRNKPGSQNSQAQSSWADTPYYDQLADIVRRSQEDAARLDATCFDDGVWFQAHSGRRFHLRQGTPHERDTGLACGLVLVARYSGGRIRIPVPFPELAGCDPSRHDTEEKARELFDWLTWGHTAENTHPFLFGVIKEIRGARHG
jgi:hypothetical protein